MKWPAELSQLKDLAMRRRYFDAGDDGVDLHISAASSEAMCIVAYPSQRSTGKLSFVIGENRKAPMSFTSFASLELQADLY